MNKYISVDDIQQIFQVRQKPTITLWNRLEASPRAVNFDRALQAEVRDALWMLCKQWQLGEFMGDDAGSPVSAKIHVAKTALTKYVPGENAVQFFDDSIPLETKVEQRTIPFQRDEKPISLNLRLQMGRHWLKMAGKALKAEYLKIERYRIEKPDKDDKENAYITAHKESWQQFSAVSGRCIDGYKLYQYLKHGGGQKASDDIIGDLALKEELDKKGERFTEWFEGLYYQPSDPQENAWKPSALEYQFACATPSDTGEKTMVASEYYHGHLDWFNLDVDPSRTLGNPAGTAPADPRESLTTSFIPVPVTFDGMPHTRWWTFEDGITSFGDIDTSTTDLNKLLFMEFGLVYANDWFMFPLTLPAGSMADIKGLTVTNVFGERIWVESAGKGKDEDWQRWSMFNLSTMGDANVPADNSVVILPTVSKIQESKPYEEFMMLRDEVANMVWAIEQKVSLAHGENKHGGEAAFELKKKLQQLLDKTIEDGTVIPEIKEYAANIRYEVMNTVPENWIPFIPVRKPGDIREIQLQRASMPRILQNDPANSEKIRPLTNLLREGLEASRPYFIHEEEVPRAGIIVRQSFQRARWYNGKVYNWFGARKQTGKGEGHSGLAFDRILPVEKK